MLLLVLLIVSLKLLTEYAATGDEESAVKTDDAAAAEDLAHLQNEVRDETDDVTVTSDGGKRRNKTWRRPAVNSGEKKQKTSSAQPNTDGMSAVWRLLIDDNSYATKH